nr:leucine-rich repeat-containing protein 23 isoform X3 [Caretta caretta]
MSDEDFEEDYGASEREKEGEEGEEEKEPTEEEEEESLSPRLLTEEILKEGLSLLCKTGNGLAHAYVKLEAKEKDLTDISLLQNYIHLRYVDLSENQLRDLSPLGSLIHLLWLKVDGNRLTSTRLTELPYLQIASFAHNRIKDTEGITHPRLGSLNLKGNEIQVISGLDPGKLTNLHTVELRGNKLETTAGLHLPKLKNLYLLPEANPVSRVVSRPSLRQSNGRQSFRAFFLCGRPTKASMEAAQLTLAIRSTLNTTRIIQQYMQHQNLAKRYCARRRRQLGHVSDQDMDTDFSESMGPANACIMVLMGQVHAVERRFWARKQAQTGGTA